ncbi:MAG: hypothetical protein AAGB16_00880 [Pseudomonadota bacterium]
MADIFEEVEEGVRQDRMTELWRKYGWAAWLTAGLLIGGVALNEYLNYQSAQTVTRNAAQLEGGIDELTQGEYEAAGGTFAELAGSDVALAPVAAQYLSQVRLEGNGDAGAAAQVLADSIDETADSAIEKLALIKSAYLKADDMTREELQTYLGGLTAESSAFGVLALELVAAKAMAEGDYAFARSEFNLIRVSANVPPGVARRASQALAAMPIVVQEEPEQEAEAASATEQPVTEETVEETTE